jgi:ketosteroid isomerase-like protein
LSSRRASRSRRVAFAASVLVFAGVCHVARGADGTATDPTALPLAAKTVVARAQECAVWRRERSFSRSVEAHDAAAFASHLHADAIFDAGAVDATRGRDAIVAGWSGIIEGKALVLRWRPGVVDIGGDPGVALSRGPYILQSVRDGKPAFNVGFYQTVWRRDAADDSWRVLFDGGASTPMAVDGRAAAEAWVRQQTMSDCASS